MIATPALVIDVDAMEVNLEAAASAAAAAGVGLRPHAKTHKCAAIAQRQLDHGARGICVAKLSEAEAMAAAGIGLLLVTSPVHPDLVTRVADLSRSVTDLMVVVDHPDVITPLARAVEQVDGADGIGVLVDLDVGLQRTGVTSAEAAVRLAEAIADDRSLRFRGLQAYGGHWQHLADPSARRAAVSAGAHLVDEAAQRIESTVTDVELRTGGGTGTFAIDCEEGVLDDLQPGSYALFDQQYADALADDASPWQQALFVQATVVSANHPGHVTLDAGMKALATDAGAPRGPAGTSYSFFGDEHGLLTNPSGSPLRLGDRVDLVPPHCDPTVDRFDVVHLVRDDVLIDVVAVTGRGCSQ